MAPPAGTATVLVNFHCHEKTTRLKEIIQGNVYFETHN